MERASSVMASLLLTVNVLNECKNVFGLPYGSAGAKLDGFGVASRLAASPPRAFTDRDKSLHLRKAKKTGFGNVGKHVNAPFADGTKKNALLGHWVKEAHGLAAKEARGLLKTVNIQP